MVSLIIFMKLSTVVSTAAFSRPVLREISLTISAFVIVVKFNIFNIFCCPIYVIFKAKEGAFEFQHRKYRNFF